MGSVVESSGSTTASCNKRDCYCPILKLISTAYQRSSMPMQSALSVAEVIEDRRFGVFVAPAAGPVARSADLPPPDSPTIIRGAPSPAAWASRRSMYSLRTM